MRELRVSKSKLAEQYEDMTIAELTEYYGVCCARLYRMLDECGIPRKMQRATRRPAPKVVYEE